MNGLLTMIVVIIGSIVGSCVILVCLLILLGACAARVSKKRYYNGLKQSLIEHLEKKS